MNTKEAIKSNLRQTDMIVAGYLNDLTNEELMVRALPGTNHIAWQLGHLVGSERWLINKAFPDRIAPLPAGFEAKHKTATSNSDNASEFLTKEEYLSLAKTVRGQALALLDEQSEADLSKPVEGLPPMVQNVGDLFNFLGIHWLMHAGQWAIVRRKIGRTPLF